MKSLILVAVGGVVGFLVAERVTRDRAARRVLAVVRARATAFSSAVADGYRSREAELRRDTDR